MGVGWLFVVPHGVSGRPALFRWPPDQWVYSLSVMRTASLIGLLLIGLLCASRAEAQPDPDREDWRQLFNGKDLSGWIPKINGHELGDNFNKTFRVENGRIVVSYDRYDDFGERFGHIFYREKFSYYIVGVEYRFVGEQAPGGPGWARRNSGVMVHGQAPETMGKDQNFPISIEVQLLGGLGEGPRPTANLCTPGTHVVMDAKLLTRHCTQSNSPTFDGGRVGAVRGRLCWEARRFATE